jgi:succinate-semialdehyde dehydrogenase / glutarate-semialdehyde dehydrogenase
MFIHEEIYEKFLAEFVNRVKALRLGAEIGWDYEIGSLATKAIFDRVCATIENAISQGATVLTGGQAHPEIGPFVYAPTVLTGVTKEMDIYHDEVFGPCVYVLPFKNNAEAIELANDSKFGLSASVITKNLKQGYAIAKQIEAGSVSVNDGFAAAFGSVAAPMGGMGESGLGRRHGVEGLMRFTEPQTIAMHGRYLVGPKFGLSEKRWNELLEIFLRTVKRLRIR